MFGRALPSFFGRHRDHTDPLKLQAQILEKLAHLAGTAAKSGQLSIIPFPNELHKPWVLAAANAGKQVLCEKPLALDASEAAEMVEHCRKRGVVLMEAFMWRHQPRSLELRKLVQSGTIGELRLIRSSFSFPIGTGDWRLEPARGEGPSLTSAAMA